MQAVNGVQSDSQAVSGVSEWWSVVKCVRVMVKQSVVSQSDSQAVIGVSE